MSHSAQPQRAQPQRAQPVALLVAYGWSAAQEDRWSHFLSGWCPTDRALVVQNDPTSPDCARFRTLRGSNAFAEFSGYLEGYDALAPEHGGSAPVFVVNDTLFSHRWSTGWKRAVRLWAHRPPLALLGDPRHDPLPGTDRTLHFLSSWIFALHGPDAHRHFRAGLVAVQSPENWGVPAYPEPEYRLMVRDYLDGRRGRGWSRAGRATAALRALKEQCIYAEHRLGIIWTSKVGGLNADSRFLPDKSVFRALFQSNKRGQTANPHARAAAAARDANPAEVSTNPLILGSLAGYWRPLVRVSDRLLSARRRGFHWTKLPQR